MNNTLKYYGIREGEFIVPLPGQKIEDVFQPVRISSQLNFDEVSFDVKYFEVFINVTEDNVEKIEPLHADKINPAALRAASDHNEYVMSLLNPEKEDNFFIDKVLIQDIIDRTLHYKEDFEADLKQLLEKYPLEVEWVTEGKDEEGNMVPISPVRKVHVPANAS